MGNRCLTCWYKFIGSNSNMFHSSCTLNSVPRVKKGGALITHSARIGVTVSILEYFSRPAIPANNTMPMIFRGEINDFHMFAMLILFYLVTTMCLSYAAYLPGE